MRLLAISMLLILAEASASACPAGTSCVAAETRSSSSKEHDSRPGAIDHELARPGVPPARVHSTTLLEHAFARLADRDPLAYSLRTYVVARSRAAQMPWVWQVLRKSVYARMPSYESSGRPESRFSVVLAPVVVDSPSDTVPGFGVAGAF